MTEQEKNRLLELGELLSTLGVEFRIAPPRRPGRRRFSVVTSPCAFPRQRRSF